ncbi:Gfo/Idh/MocA family protein [Treponema pectinovorum]|uniref:Gfo/Idh/MocA family protein n=1 Tax=Treponema pectinovorum TaxID=164 RepID=UPI003D8EC083
MKKNIYTAAIIGVGRIGFSLGFDKKREQPASHTMALFNNKQIKLVAACDFEEQKLDSWKGYAKKYAQVSTFHSSEGLYQNIKDIDLITIAVNEENHEQECIRAIEYKPKLVILEKPVALNSSQAEKIADCARFFNVPVMVNHERRFDKNYLAARLWLCQIGEIQSVRGELDSGLRIYSKEFEKDGTYSLLHDGTHLVDIIRFLLDVELENPTLNGVFKDEKQIVRNFCAHYTTQKIPSIDIYMSGRSKFFEFRLEILGTLGKICIGNGFTELYLRQESSLYTGFYSLKKQRIKLPKKTGYFSGMVQNAVDFLDGQSELISSLEDAIIDLKVLEDIKSKF